MRTVCLALALAVFTGSAPSEVFDRVDLLIVDGERTESVPVRLRLDKELCFIESRKSGAVLKVFRYADIKSAEYSYSKHPRWKAGAGTAIGSAIVLPLLIVAIPLAFSKSKRHWLTIRSETDYAVLRLDKHNQKAILPAFEVHSGVEVEALGESK